MAAGRGQVGEVGAEVGIAGGAIVPGVDDLEESGSVAEQAAEVVQGAVAAAVPITRASATGTRSMAVVPRALADKGLGKVFDTCDPLGAIGEVLSGSHGQLR
jgi:hypothetical protein